MYTPNPESERRRKLNFLKTMRNRLTKNYAEKLSDYDRRIEELEKESPELESLQNNE